VQVCLPGENRLMAVWRGKHWVVVKNYWKPSLLRWDFPIILGKFKTSREAKNFCEEYYAAEKRVESENRLQQHPHGDEKGIPPEAGGGDCAKRRRKVKEREK
jgi:hypothetical protein